MAISVVSFEDLTALSIEQSVDVNVGDCAELRATIESLSSSESLAGRESNSKAAALIAAICSVHFRPDDKVEPFGPMLVMDGKRTFQGSDLLVDQLDALERFAEATSIIALSTRIFDMIWFRERRRAAVGRAAIKGYCALIEGLLDGTYHERFSGGSTIPVSVVDLLSRAGAVARGLGWLKPENEDLKKLLLRVLDAAASSSEAYLVVKLATLCLKWGILEPADVLSKTEALTNDALIASSLDRAEALQKFRAGCSRRLSNEIHMRESLALVNIFELKADQHAGAYMASHFIENAIGALQGVKGVKDKRLALQSRLRNEQLNAFEDIGVISRSTDITEIVERYTESVRGLDLFDQIAVLSRVALPIDKADLQVEAAEQVKKYPLSSIMGGRGLDANGRTVSRHDAVDLMRPSEASFKATIVRSESVRIGIAVVGAINPIRQYISFSRHIQLDVIRALCANSPFVPDEQELAVSRGLLAFLCGDDMAAASILPTFLESGLRRMLNLRGFLITSIDEFGVEELINLSVILGEKKIREISSIYGESFVFCLDLVFNDGAGPKVRHRVAHSLFSDDEYGAATTVYANYLVFALVILSIGDWESVKSHIAGLLPTSYYAAIGEEAMSG